MNRTLQLCLVFAAALSPGLNAASAQGNRPPCNTADSLALVALFDSTNGTAWTQNTNWLREGSWVRSWYGVNFEADTTDRIVELKLFNNNIAGAIPAAIGDLSELQTLELGSNSITSLPATIGNLAKLESLNLSRNQLSSIPSAIGGLTSLRSLGLSSNQLAGSLPVTLGSLPALESLAIGNNQFAEIPSAILGLARLKSLDLSRNQLADTLNDLRDLAVLDSLVALGLSHNELKGPIPEWIRQYADLEWLDLKVNSLSGQIPATISSLSKLRMLDLTSNRLTGAVPQEITQLAQLSRLHLGNNFLTAMPELNPLYVDSHYPTSELHLWLNRFTFEHLIPNLGKANTVSIAPQKELGSTMRVTAEPGQTKAFVWNMGGTGNSFQWLKDGAEIAGATSSELELVGITDSDAGSYVLSIENSGAPDLTLTTNPFHLTVQPLFVCSASKRASTSDSGCAGTHGQRVIVLRVKGDAEVLRDGNPDPIELRGGEILIGGDRIYTGIESEVEIAFADNSTVIVGELSDVKISVFRDLGDSVQTRLWLKAGEAAAKVQKEGAVKSDFQIKTPTVTCGVRGTDFGVSHDEGQVITEVVVSDGQVTVVPDFAPSDSVRLVAWEGVSAGTTSIGTPQAITLSRIEVSPSEVSVAAEGVRRFLALGFDGGDHYTPVAVNWSAEGGEIFDDGFFVAGPAEGTFTVTAMEPNSGQTAQATVHVTAAVGTSTDPDDLPRVFELEQNYPNPFNPSTTVSFSLPAEGLVEFVVYNVLGERVRVLEARRLVPGRYTYRFDAGDLPSGVYLYRLSTPVGWKTRPMVLLR